MNYNAFLKSLNDLVSELSDHIINDEQSVTNLKTVWQLGQEVYTFKQESGHTTKEIAIDLGIPPGTMDKFVRAYRLWPDGLNADIDGNPLTWSHYAALIYVRSKRERDFYLKEAAKNSWSSHEMRRRLRNNFYENRHAPDGRKRKDKPALSKGRQTFFTYEAKVLRVVDADTLLLEIDVGYKIKVEHKVRLRGINCAEAGTALGERARAYVTKALTGEKMANGQVVVRSYKEGKFGRYIVDVWYATQETDREQILKKGTLLNQELLDKGLAVLVE